VIFLDLGLPDMDGTEVIRKVRTWSGLPIIVISARAEESDKIEALDAGADDYLTKPFSVEELLARLRATLRRLESLRRKHAEGESPVFADGPLRIDYAAGEVRLGEEPVHLTRIEFKLLCLLSQNPDKVLTYRFITQNVWGDSSESSMASLRVFMASLRRKIDMDPEQPLIRTHIGIGYRLNRKEAL
jgi:two-component system KDP operon response regulator KdpE